MLHERYMREGGCASEAAAQQTQHYASPSHHETIAADLERLRSSRLTPELGAESQRSDQSEIRASSERDQSEFAAYGEGTLRSRLAMKAFS